MFKRNISILALVIAITITLFFLYTVKSFKVSTGPFPMDWSTTIPEDDTSFGGLFAFPDNSINDSLPHYEYKKKEDSLKRIFDARQLDNKSISYGKTYGSIGAYYVKKTWQNSWDNNSKNDPLIRSMQDSIDTLNQKWVKLKDNKDSIKKLKEQLGDIMWRFNVRSNELLQEMNKNEEKLYYLGLNGYSPTNYNTKFFMDKGTYNLAYVKWDSVVKRKYDSTKTGHYERKQIPVRYTTEDKRILIPISKKQFSLIDGFLNTWTFIWLFLFVYFFIGLPIQILINISKGNAFNKKNILRFKIMAYVLFAYALASTLIPYVLKFFFRKLIPDDFKYQSIIQSLLNNLYLFLIAIAIFIIAKAFQKGYKLQQEQDLTI